MQYFYIYINPTMATNRLDEDERTKLNLGRQGAVNIVNELWIFEVKRNTSKNKRKITKALD